jgi:NAD(P)-dependent dehydrogenase (short-subunit alcohol dehydrogenase family)
MSLFANKNIVITGAATGVGKVIAHEYAKEGAHVFIGDFQEPTETMDLIRELGGRVGYCHCDIRKEDEVIAFAKAASEFFDGNIDILVNNAGFNGKVQQIKDMRLADWDNTLKINLTGTMLVTREIIPYMIRNNRGNIVNVASNVARRGLPYRGDYVASKWALIGLTQTLALELAEANIRVNAVCPGPINVDRIHQVMEMHAEGEGRPIEEVAQEWADAAPMKRFIEPEEVAGVVKFLSGSASSAMTGQAINVTGGFIMT